MMLALRPFYFLSFRIGVIAAVIFALVGCAPDPAEKALETDANGYLCQGCQNKFYTERSVFADICPNCKSMQLAQVVGFVCPDDKHMTVAPRASGYTACEKCKKTTSGLAIPRESDLKAWGAPKKSETEVGKL
jgi:hypothetical protein